MCPHPILSFHASVSALPRSISEADPADCRLRLTIACWSSAILLVPCRLPPFPIRPRTPPQRARAVSPRPLHLSSTSFWHSAPACRAASPEFLHCCRLFSDLCFQYRNMVCKTAIAVIVLLPAEAFALSFPCNFPRHPYRYLGDPPTQHVELGPRPKHIPIPRPKKPQTTHLNVGGTSPKVDVALFCLLLFGNNRVLLQCLF